MTIPSRRALSLRLRAKNGNHAATAIDELAGNARKERVNDRFGIRELARQPDFEQLGALKERANLPNDIVGQACLADDVVSFQGLGAATQGSLFRSGQFRCPIH